MTLLSPSVDEMISEDHEVRLFEHLLASLDWSVWEKRYEGRRGQPPIHPRLMAGCLLWGLMRGIRSSRHLEDATRHRIDFIWLLSGRTIDHSTFADFRNEFEKELKGLSNDLKKVALRQMGGTGEVILTDGTLIRANSDWRGSKTATALKKALSKLGIEVEALLKEMKESDEGAGQLEEMKKRLEELEAEKSKLKQALEIAQERDAVKPKHAKETRVPVTDPESTLQRNKDGGFAPNYHTVIATDLETGLIVHEDVLENASEPASLAETIASCETELGNRPKVIVADRGFASGDAFIELKEMGVKPCIPVQGLEAIDLAVRENLDQPLPQAAVDKLPLRNGKFTTVAFVYVPESDCFYCPAGKRLERKRTLRNSGRRNGIPADEYSTDECLKCPLAKLCVRSKTGKRSVSRSQPTSLREESARYVKSDEGSQLYKQRAHLTETPFAIIKHVMGIRRFLTRGYKKVRNEWLWACTAFNFKKLLKALAENPQVSKKRPISPILRCLRHYPSTWPNTLLAA